ncbi:hypothetical protein B0H11DRAFT_1908680 [Mycena galericulata]|nr:hypothetical protein B0H11DRAFT_1908680 [Mycena galericulata]
MTEEMGLQGGFFTRFARVSRVQPAELSIMRSGRDFDGLDLGYASIASEARPPSETLSVSLCVASSFVSLKQLYTRGLSAGLNAAPASDYPLSLLEVVLGGTGQPENFTRILLSRDVRTVQPINARSMIYAQGIGRSHALRAMILGRSFHGRYLFRFHGISFSFDRVA